MVIEAVNLFGFAGERWDRITAGALTDDGDALHVTGGRRRASIVARGASV